MSINPTIKSPGVELVEKDESLRAVVDSGTTILVPGFANSGPTEEVTSVSSIEDFTQIFDYPTNAAERYFYATAEQVLKSSGKLNVCRLPYGEESGNIKSPEYTVLAYPAVGYSWEAVKTGEALSGVVSTAITKYSQGSAGVVVNSEVIGKDEATILIGEPVQFTITAEQYNRFLNGQSLDGTTDFIWSEDIGQSVALADLGKFAFLVFNIAKYNTNELFEGYYLGLADNSITDPSAGYKAITKLKTVASVPSATTGITGTDFVTVPNERLDFKLSSNSNGSISQVLADSITNYSMADASFNDSLNFGLFKIRQSTSSGDALKLTAILAQGLNASLEYGRKTTSSQTVSAVSYFVEDLTNDNTTFKVFVNPYLSGAIQQRGLKADGSPKLKVRSYTSALSDILPIDSQLAVTTATAIQSIFDAPGGLSKTAYDAITDIKKAESLIPLGVYSQSNQASKVIGNVPSKLKSIFNIVENDELYSVDLLVEGGLGSIYVGAMDRAYKEYETQLAAKSSSEKAAFKLLYPNGYIPSETIYDDTKVINGVTDLRSGKAVLSDAADLVKSNLRSVQEAFLSLATSQQNGGRGDTFYIADTIRQVVVEGKDNKVEKQFGLPLVNTSYAASDNVKHSFSTSIYWPLRHLYDGFASSFAAVYPYFVKVQDPKSSSQIWVPASGCIARKIAETDSVAGTWQAAAGINNGVISGISDISFNTNQRQRDDLYNFALNAIKNDPQHGFCIWGIRTMIKKASAFDQIPCRRTFLYINKILKATSKQFLFEGNTSYTRLQVTNTLSPIFENLVNKRALYSFILICDTRNNTTDVIDEGILAIDFYGSPTRTAERILITSHATRSGTIVTEFDS